MENHNSEYLDLTQHELHALGQEYNLADAHTHQSQSESQKQIVNRLPEIWYESENLKQPDLDKRFIKSFFTFHKQDQALKTPSMLVYAASIAMAIFSNYFNKKNLSVSLITPCFDNLHDLMKHMQVPLEPLEESWLHDPEKIYDNLSQNINSDVIFLVTPNNPTGWELTSKDKSSYDFGFKEVIRFCKDKNKILAIDFCFASFLAYDTSITTFDVYKLLEESGVSYLTIEDTGKTWPTQDAKVAIIKTSKDLHDEIFNIHTAYLLNVSPFILNFLSQYIDNSIKDKGLSITNLLETNKNIAKEAMKGSLLQFQEPKSNVSVAWFKITNPKIKATDLQKYIFKSKKVYVLPGTYFFWDDREKGEHYIRVALARDTKVFKPAVKLLRQALDEYENQ